MQFEPVRIQFVLRREICLSDSCALSSAHLSEQSANSMVEKGKMCKGKWGWQETTSIRIMRDAGFQGLGRQNAMVSSIVMS
jgi:hypothetical protein